MFTTAEYNNTAQQNRILLHRRGMYVSELLIVIKACSCSPPAKATKVVSTICPLAEIHSVNQDATIFCFGGAKAAAQWYCPACVRGWVRVGLDYAYLLPLDISKQSEPVSKQLQ